MLIYPGKVDLESLSRKRCVNSELLCRRACIDNNVNVISKLVADLEKKRRVVIRKQRGLNAIGRRLIKGQYKSLMKKATLADVLRTIGSGHSVFRVNINFEQEIKVIQSRKSFATFVEYKGKRHRLLRVDDIIGCLESGYKDEQIEASILANMKWFDLAVEEDKEKSEKASSGKNYVMYI